MDFKLYNLYGDLISNKEHEFREQRALRKVLLPSDCVLELGGNIGCSTIAINSILSDKSQHVTLEPIPELFQVLNKNISFHKCGGAILKGYLGKESGRTFRTLGSRDKNLFSSREIPARGRKLSVKSEDQSRRTAPFYHPDSFTLPQLLEHVNTPFSFLFADCEGCLPQIIQEYPELLDNLRCLLFELDYHSGMGVEIYEELSSVLLSRGFKKSEKPSGKLNLFQND